jgi:hypothetical protein
MNACPPFVITSVRTALACAIIASAFPVAVSAAQAVTSDAARTAPAVMQPLAHHEAEGGMWPISLRLTQLHAARPGDTLHFVLPDGRTLQVIHDSKLARPDGEHWLGHLKAGREFPVRLRLDDALAAGVIRTPDGGYVIGHVDGVQLIGNDLSAAARPAALDTLPSMFAPAADAETAAGSSSGDRTPAGKPADVAHLVALDLVAMSALEPGADMALSIPEHGDYRVTHDRTDAGDTDSTTWIGHLKDYGQEFRVIITSGPNGSVGNILTPSGELLLVDSGGSQWLVDPVRSGLSNPEPDHADAIGEDLPAGAMAGGGTAEGGTSAAAGTTTTSVSTTTATSGTSTTATLVDVLVLYTPGFKARNGSVWATRISQLIALSNQAYTDSGVPMRLRLVGTEQIGDSDKTGNSTTLSSLAKGTGVYKTVPALRKKYGADMVTLIRPFYMSAQGGNCGVGYIGGYNGSNIAGYGSYAYSVVSDGKDAGGSNYYCTDYTFTHELGHNMGLMHDRDTVARQGGGKGSYDYAFGHGRSGSFGSIMSYISPVIGRFSNPDADHLRRQLCLRRGAGQPGQRPQRAGPDQQPQRRRRIHRHHPCPPPTRYPERFRAPASRCRTFRSPPATAAAAHPAARPAPTPARCRRAGAASLRRWSPVARSRFRAASQAEQCESGPDEAELHRALTEHRRFARTAGAVTIAPCCPRHVPSGPHFFHGVFRSCASHSSAAATWPPPSSAAARQGAAPRTCASPRSTPPPGSASAASSA